MKQKLSEAGKNVIFFKVEVHLPRVHEELTARCKTEAAARGEVYMSPDEKAVLEPAEQDRIAEVKRIDELKAKCAKKDLNFDEEETKYQKKLAERKAKAEDKANKKKIGGAYHEKD